MTISTLKRQAALLVLPAMLACGLHAGAQYRDHGNFNNGVRDGGRGGYYGGGRGDDRYRNDDYNRNRGGIGPGKGALIGGAGGAALGALLGGGLKGTIIGGAAGAGIGAIAGKAHQNNQRNNYYRR
ncbi:hypothetical protein [Granulicella tundricola]|uniref:17 kDa surface antigen n=1 Tax=Granulicella tundricola (strain ATCC BAA-1859 / DSM 23138 / MP5ACTX9) TaxID=1198114 RepID=E8WVB7_GRATM|nr:hypothetical protein [Granulicella tundricola]ADW67292.1 hypothetical protein AciX9_0218 [Granulicella tundricola MP5ACTX9]